MNRLINFFYEMALCTLSCALFPFFIYKYFVKHKYKNSFKERLGYHFPSWDNSKPSIWIHAGSLGEVKSIVTLAKELKKQYPDNPLIISTVTESGQAEAKKSLAFADAHIYLPFDFYLIVNPIVKKVNPFLVILAESDFWYNFLRCAKQNGAFIAVVSGKISETSSNRFHSVPFFSKRLFGLINMLYTQTDFYKERFIYAGADENRIKVTGNLKFDDVYPQLLEQEVVQWQQQLGISPNQPVLTIGSTHSPEEKFFITTLKEVWKQFPDLKVILVPRHSERFKEVAQLLEKEEIDFINYSAIEKRSGKEKIILFDVMGKLRQCYQISTVSFVAGTFNERVGGHNILEPCWYGKPVLFGPYVHSQLELLSLMKAFDAGKQVTEADLKQTLESWLSNPQERQKYGENGLKLIASTKGSVKRTFDALLADMEQVPIKK